jgi:hypothetical protein
MVMLVTLTELAVGGGGGPGAVTSSLCHHNSTFNIQNSPAVIVLAVALLDGALVSTVFIALRVIEEYILSSSTGVSALFSMVYSLSEPSAIISRTGGKTPSLPLHWLTVY